MILSIELPSQVQALLESGYCHVDLPQEWARPVEGQNVIVCDRTCHVVSVVDQVQKTWADRWQGVQP